MAVVDGRGIVCLAFCCGARATLAPKHKGGTTKDLIFVTTLQATIDFEKKSTTILLDTLAHNF